MSTPHTTTAGAAPRLTDAEIRDRGMNPFLRPAHCTDGESFALTGWARYKDGQIIIEVENTTGVREGSPDHRILHKALGADWKTWAGFLTVKIAAGKKAGTSFVNVATAGH